VAADEVGVSLVLQWITVGLIGLGAVYMLLRHFGFGVRDRKGCPGCSACKSKPGDKVQADRTHLPGIRPHG
jgi:hypothetical protein